MAIVNMLNPLHLEGQPPINCTCVFSNKPGCMCVCVCVGVCVWGGWVCCVCVCVIGDSAVSAVPPYPPLSLSLSLSLSFFSSLALPHPVLASIAPSLAHHHS